MTSRALFGAFLAALCVAASVGAGPARAQGVDTTSPAKRGDDQKAGGDELSVVTVTGSRIITDNVRSPTPITSVSVDEIAMTTPSDTADALNKLPDIIGGRTPRTQGNGSTNNGGNVLSLRNFGPSRTLVLLDGHRVAPSNQDGTRQHRYPAADADEPGRHRHRRRFGDLRLGCRGRRGQFRSRQEVHRADVKADVGESKYGDGEEYQLGVAWGTELFGGRGHFETSARYRHQDMIPISARPYGEDGQAWLLAGNGSPTEPLSSTCPIRACSTAASPATYSAVRPAPTTTTPSISRASSSPMVHGTPTGTANLESGGDGSYVKYGTFRSGHRHEGRVRPPQLRLHRQRELVCPGDAGRKRETLPTGSTG